MLSILIAASVCVDCLNGDRNVLKSTPYVHEVPAVVVDKDCIDKEVSVTTSVEFDGVVQSKESMEKAGFFSIVTARDI